MNGKTQFKIWAKHPAGRKMEGKIFHLRSDRIKGFCLMLKGYGWKITNIGRVKRGIA